MINTSWGRYFYKPIDEVREEIIGLKVIDIEEKGRAIFLEGENGREYVLDTTGEEVVAHKFLNEKERLSNLEEMLSALMHKFNVEEEELLEIINDMQE